MSLLTKSHDRAITNCEELAAELNSGVDKVRETMQHTRQYFSMNAPLNEDDDNSLLDPMPSSEFVVPDDAVLDESDTTDIENALSVLEAKEAEFTRLYFRIGHEHP